MDSYQVFPQYIAYFDILGYKALVDDDEQSGDLFRSVVELAQSVISAQNPNTFGAFGFRTLAFSDNFIIIVDPHANVPEELQIAVLIILVATIQLHCLTNYGLLIRGGITYERVFVNDHIVYGGGVVKAVNLESLAEYPRIIVDSSVSIRIEELGHKATNFLIARDRDGQEYIDFFFPALARVARDSILTGIADRMFSPSRYPSLGDIKRSIEHLIYNNCKYGNLTNQNSILEKEKTIRKHAWLVDRFNEFCRRNGEQDFSVDYQLVLNRRTLRYELRL